ncbi:MAG: pyridoxal 5'-phosphate synthase glutaminase subunit PdxT [Bacteriovoracaceae bacterium]|nr:pyridoxal 5'-phosphate synthase glutaminase subunit PdxT [Bacteriovoracaceae bacterium]
MNIGILSLQGCVEPHIPHLKALGANPILIKHSRDFENLQGLILPGGESTTMLKLLDVFSMEKDFLKACEKIPVWGICAGSILMAQKIEGSSQKCFGLLPITIKRNAYGSQLDSFETSILNYNVSFIRAPIITDCSPQVEVLAHIEKNPVWIIQGKNMACTFHSELNTNYPSPMHEKFLSLCQK